MPVLHVKYCSPTSLDEYRYRYRLKHVINFESNDVFVIDHSSSVFVTSHFNLLTLTMIRVACSLRYLQRGTGSNNSLALASFRVGNNSRILSDASASNKLFSSARSFGSTTNCEEVKSFGNAAPAPPSFDETMSRLFLESSSKDLPTISEVVPAAAWEPSWWPSDQILLLLNFVQETTGTPLAITIIATTLSIRVLLFPLFVKAQQNQSRMAHLSPELTILKAKVDAKGSNITQAEQLKMGQQMKALFAKYKVNPATGLLVPLVQMPIFM